MNVRALLSFAIPYRGRLALCGALMLVETAAGLAVPWLGGRFAAGVLSDQMANIQVILLGLILLFALQAVVKFVNGSILAATSESILADLRIRIYDHLQSLPLRFFHERRQGDILALLTYEVARLSDYLTGTLLSVIPLLLAVTGALILMVRIDPTLTGLAAVLIPLFYLVLKIMGRRLRPLARELQQAHAAAIATAEEGLGMLPAIKTFTREELESQRHTAEVLRVKQLSTTQQRISAALEPTLQFMAATSVVLLLWLASARITAGTLSPPELVSFLLYAALLTRPVSALANIYGRTQMARGYLAHLQSVLTERPEPIFGGGQILTDVRGALTFRHVTFAYPGRAPTLLDLDLDIKAGETVALTGENGAGKSTLVHLLMRLHEPQSGQILIDGIDIADVSLHSLRRQIGIVPQHVLLFNGTVRDNIGFGRSDATVQEIEVAARLAQAHDFVAALPKGYDTPIGDQGIRLSGGQRQRIALARALLKDPPILILDEATAMFDPDGEKSFIEDCRATLANRTVILITHRPASLALADRVIQLRQGGVSARGAA